MHFMFVSIHLQCLSKHSSFNAYAVYISICNHVVPFSAYY